MKLSEYITFLENSRSAWRWLIQQDVELGTKTKLQQGTLLPASLNRNQTFRNRSITASCGHANHMILETFYKNNNKLFIPHLWTDYFPLQTLGQCELGFECDLICSQ